MTRLHINRTVDGVATDPPIDPTRAEQRSRAHLRADKYLWGIYIMLLIFSIIELYSASSAEVRGENVYSPLITHALYLFIGLGLVCVMKNIHYKYYRKLAWPAAVFAALLLLYSNLFGININGAMRAISVAGFTVQPPEIAKLAVVLVLARIMAKYQMRHGVTNKGIILSLAVLGTFAALLFRNGLTNTILLMLVAAAMFVIGGTQWRKIGVLFVLVCLVGTGVFFAKYDDDDENVAGNAGNVTLVENRDSKEVDRSDTQKGRISTWRKGVTPKDTVNDGNRQVIFSKIAQAHGGILGNGPGNSRESARLPLAFSDYIYSIIIEDTGMVGGIILLLLYLCLIGRAGVIATKCTKAFPALLITGCASLIVVQALIHMFINTGLMPVSGQPLPFISKGGTSIVVMSAAMGMMLSVSKYAIQQHRNADTNEALKKAVDDSSDDSANPTQLTYTSL